MARSTLVLLVGILAVGCTSTGNRTAPANGEFSEAPAFLKEEIEERVASMPYQSDQMLYSNLIRLAYIGEPAIPYLLDGLKSSDARTRASCAYVLGLMRDRRTIEPLRSARADPVPEVRYEVGTALCILGAREGYEVLIEGLSDSEIRNRYKCHEALKLLTHLDFGYVHDAEPSERAAAVRQWQAWWEKMRQSP